jgi:hypothetical protein
MRVVTPTPSHGATPAANSAIRAVFNIELGEGLAGSFDSGIGRDQFDEVCAHLIVLHDALGKIVVTYRARFPGTPRPAGAEA